VIPLRRPDAQALPAAATAALSSRAEAMARAGDSAARAWEAFAKTAPYQALRAALAAAADHKCAYCEGAAPRPQVDHVLPKQGHPDLAFSLDNLLPACAACNHAKGAQGGLGPDGRPRLIDPSAEDPAASLVWDTRGFVRPRDLADDAAHDRAADTIRALNLIRKDLQDGQRTALTEAAAALIAAEQAAAAHRLAPPAEADRAAQGLAHAGAALIRALDLARPHRALLRQWVGAPAVAARLAALAAVLPPLQALLTRWAALDALHPRA
jgi:uncharacterized protein (TIGR02646 family)